jgi:geranylgeranyl diphosphate synthase type I
MLADIESLIAHYQAHINESLEVFFDMKIAEAAKLSPYTEDVVVNAKTYTLRSGKRLRPIFFIYGYKCFSDNAIDAVIEASISTELMQSFLLIHDDIMDEDELRRGKPTFHVVYKTLCEEHFGRDSSQKFGENIAILAGDLLEAYGKEVLAHSRFNDEYVNRALRKYAEIVKNVGYGQILDVISSKKGIITEDELLVIHRLKTAEYTIDGPLQIGALLAGANEGDLQYLSDYGVPLGLAFQIQDDILGLFGSEEKIGKPVDSDIREGKKTLLVIHALKHCSDEEKEMITRSLGNEDVTMDDIEHIKDIVRETGSLEYSKKLVREKITEAIRAIEKAPVREEAKEFLIRIADFIGKRDY